MAEENEPNIRPERAISRLWKATVGSPWLWPFCAGMAVGLVVFAAAAVLVWPLARVSPSTNNRAPASGPAPAPAAAARAAESALHAYTIFSWRDGVGVLRRAGVDTAAYEAFVADEQSQIDDNQRLLALARASRLRTELAPVFEQIDNRVSGYADWVFDWWTSWILLARTFEWTGKAVTSGPLLTLPDRVQAQLVGAVQQQFVTRVLEPQTLEPQIDAALHAALVAMRKDLLVDCAKYQQSLADFIRGAARQVERRDPAQGWLPDPEWKPATAAFEPLCDQVGAIDEKSLRAEFPILLEPKAIDSPVNDVIVRMARPFATKAISFVVLPVIVAAILGGILLPLFGQLPSVLANVITGVLTGAVGALIIGLSASASVDWLLNRTDAALNRPGFEVSVRKAIVAMEGDFETRVLDVEKRSIDRQMQELATAMAGKIAAH